MSERGFCPSCAKERDLDERGSCSVCNYEDGTEETGLPTLRALLRLPRGRPTWGDVDLPACLRAAYRLGLAEGGEDDG